jgi:segregation and condensation protein A
MAATLIHVKSKMLLPRPETAQEDAGDEEDPREALVRRLLEHQKYRAAAELLHERELVRGAQHTRPDERVEAVVGEDYEPELEVDLFSLMAAFRGVLERASRKPRMVIPPEQISIEDRMAQLLARLSETDACGFEDLFADGDGSKPFLIVTFLALLEMIRLKLVRAFQAGGAGAIRIYKRARPADAPHPIGDPS